MVNAQTLSHFGMVSFSIFPFHSLSLLFGAIYPARVSGSSSNHMSYLHHRNPKMYFYKHNSDNKNKHGDHHIPAITNFNIVMGVVLRSSHLDELLDLLCKCEIALTFSLIGVAWAIPLHYLLQ